MPFKCNSYFAIIVLSTVLATHSQLLKDFPDDVRDDVITIFTKGTVRSPGTCIQPNNSAPLTEYWIYTRDDTQNPTIVKQPNLNLTPTRSKIVIISHGWLVSAKAINIVLIKDAYLKKYDAHVILVNWQAYSRHTYHRTFCTVPRIASNVANFLCQLSHKYNVSLGTIHAVGHSLGAQLFGITGRLVFERCGQTLGRITGLDPAGPLYQGIDVANRLDSSDADFVDVLHTNQGLAGYQGRTGHLDSYPNCGFYQPGCELLVHKRYALQNRTGILDIPRDIVFCSHERSCDFFAESISSDKFIARQCEKCGIKRCGPKPYSFEKRIIGESCTQPGKAYNYVFYTNLFAPFAKG